MSEEYFDRETRGLDDQMIAAYKRANVQVVDLSSEQFAKWRTIAQDTSYKVFSESVRGGDALIKKALSVD
jgi:TRAP-type C4-dicarboxylate transport system substrate-binding protein